MTTDAQRKARAEKRKRYRERKRLKKQGMAAPRATTPSKANPNKAKAVVGRSRITPSAAFEGFDNAPVRVYGRTSGPVDEIDLIVACMALPDQAPAMRLAPGDTSRSAKGQTFERINAQWSTEAINDTLTAFTQRVAECSEIVQTYNNTGVSGYGYDFKLINDAPGSEDVPPSYSGSLVTSATSQSLQWTVGTAIAGKPFQPHSDQLFAGAVANSLGCFVWMEAGDVINLDYTWNIIGAGSGSLAFSLDRWTATSGLQSNEEGNEALVSDAEPTGVIAVTVSKSGYYAPRWSFEVSNTTFALSLSLVGNASVVWGHRYMPEYAKFSGVCTGIVPTGVAMMYSNRAAEGYRQGELVAFQIPKGQHWMNYQSYDSIFSAEGSIPMNAKNGEYIPLKPSDPSELQFQTYTQVNVDGIVTRSRWPLDGGRPVVVISAKINAGSESAPNPRDGFWSFLYNFQFQTASKWFDKDFSTITNVQIQAALDRFRWMPIATENPSHFTKFVKSIMKTGNHVVKGVEKYGPKVISAANTASTLAKALGV